MGAKKVAKKGVKMASKNLKVEYVDINSIQPYKNNARKHDTKDITAIKKSIEEFGFNDPIGVWHDEIVEGHGRLLAAKELGFDKVPIIRLDALTEEQRKAYTLAHNKTAELSAWDFNVLDSELAEISDIDMSQFGFDLAEMESPPERKDLSGNIAEQWQVIIDCPDEETQQELFDRLMGEGLNCRVLTL